MVDWVSTPRLNMPKKKRKRVRTESGVGTHAFDSKSCSRGRQGRHEHYGVTRDDSVVGRAGAVGF